ncbi:hypothetical protein L6452_22677 [Arctium lappa]|uniref:Uncharacterized protein n=1 Tax=Arctium lappa TaxID=4217 RepID=A0ACB9B1R3_ARCLA|nr:hypothetical protein L6452_22677 [Arctium lappa]
MPGSSKSNWKNSLQELHKKRASRKTSGRSSHTIDGERYVHNLKGQKKDFSYTKILKDLKEFCCNGTVVQDPELGQFWKAGDFEGYSGGDWSTSSDYCLHSSDQNSIMRWHKVLWTILELDRKWLLFQKRKSDLQLYYNKRFEEEQSIYDETRLHLDQKFFQSITKPLKVAETASESHNMAFAVKLNGRKLLASLGITQRNSDYGFLLNKRMDELEDAKETPEEVASRFTCVSFENPQAVLRGARHMAVVEISCEPFVRKHGRRIFMDNATVSTSPTADGNVDIDSHHKFVGIKWLRDKPLTKFEDAQWLLIQKAEEEKLIKVSFKLPTPIHHQLINVAHDFYLSGGVSKSFQLWNEQRMQILKDAFDGFLLPSMEKEARALLTSRAKNWEVLHVLYAGSVSICGQSVNDQQRKKNDQQRIVKFIADHQL